MEAPATAVSGALVSIEERRTFTIDGVEFSVDLAVQALRGLPPVGEPPLELLVWRDGPRLRFQRRAPWVATGAEEPLPGEWYEVALRSGGAAVALAGERGGWTAAAGPSLRAEDVVAFRPYLPPHIPEPTAP